MGLILPDKILSKEIYSRRFFINLPEPPSNQLLSDPTKSIYIGKTKFLKVPFYWDPNKLVNPHVAIVGITGSGKSYLTKTFLTRANLVMKTNAIILDWVGEYKDWVNQVNGKVIKLGGEDGLNLMDLGGMTPINRTKQIMDSLEILTDIKSHALQKRFTEQAITETYKPNKSNKKTVTLHDVIKQLKTIKKSQKTEQKKDAVEDCIIRLTKYTVKGNDYFSKKSTLNFDKLINSGLVCIDLHQLPSEQLRSLAGLTILQFIKEKMRTQKLQTNDKDIKLIVVVDEAWKIANDEKSDVITIVREGRKYNFSLIVASQNPTDVHKTIFSNVGTVFVMRLLFKEFKNYVRSSLNYNDFIARNIDSFGVGQCAVYQAYRKHTEHTNIFILDKIDGEELLLTYKIKGDNMEIEFEKETFKRKLIQFGLKPTQIDKLCNEFEKNNNSVNVLLLVEYLEKYGFARSVTLTFLRELGIKEGNLISLFSKLQHNKLGSESDKLARMVVDYD